MAGKLTIGALDSLEDVKQGLRDVETFMNALLPDDAPTGDAQLIMRDSEGAYRQYTLQSSGGCTITIDDATRIVSISVP